MEERRRYPRYRADLEVEYAVENSVEILSKTRASDISRVGVGMPLNKAIKPGKKIHLTIKVPSLNKEVKALGKVVWKKPLRKNYQDEEDAGVKFLGMYEDGESVLTEYLQGMAAAG